MNHSRMLKLAREIAKPKALKGVAFNMKHTLTYKGTSGSLCFSGDVKDYTCGSACCVAGLAVLLFGDQGQAIVMDIAGRLLDLTSAQQEQLFLNDGDYISQKLLSKITKKEAVAAIRRMIKDDLTAAVPAAVPVGEK